jgi:TonB family protein
VLPQALVLRSVPVSARAFRDVFQAGAAALQAHGRTDVPTSRYAGHQDTVTLAFLVDENGHMKDSKVTGSSGFRGLDMAAQVALGNCSFHPALENGKPVEKWTHVQYVWALH